MTTSSLPSRTPIALVEGNAALRDEIVFHLECAGYAAIGLPGEDGSSICAGLRAQRPEFVVASFSYNRPMAPKALCIGFKVSHGV